jgi:C4-dicarboxylate-specific signal transduction histidine kinase
MVQAHMELDIKAKVQLLAGVLDRPEEVPAMLRKQPQILALSEVTIQVTFLLPNPHVDRLTLQ